MRTSYNYKVGHKVRIVTTVRERRGKLFGFEHKGPYNITMELSLLSAGISMKELISDG